MAKKPNGTAPAADSDTSPGANRPSDADLVKVARTIIKKDTEILEAREAMNSLVGERRGFVKAAKKQGHDMAALLRVIRERNLEVDDVAREDRNYRRYTMLLNRPLGTQFDLWGSESGDNSPLEGEEAVAQRVFDAEQQGYHAGRNGHKRDTNPHHQTEASELHQAFNTGWLRGQERIAQGMGPKNNEIKAPTEIRPRGRPRKTPEADGRSQLEKDTDSYRGTDQTAAE